MQKSSLTEFQLFTEYEELRTAYEAMPVNGDPKTQYSRNGVLREMRASLLLLSEQLGIRRRDEDLFEDEREKLLDQIREVSLHIKRTNSLLSKVNKERQAHAS